MLDRCGSWSIQARRRCLYKSLSVSTQYESGSAMVTPHSVLSTRIYDTSPSFFLWLSAFFLPFPPSFIHLSRLHTRNQGLMRKLTVDDIPLLKIYNGTTFYFRGSFSFLSISPLWPPRLNAHTLSSTKHTSNSYTLHIHLNHGPRDNF
jgi:hypothetical protein